LIDLKLLKEFFVNNNTNLFKPAHEIIDLLIYMGIIDCSESKYSFCKFHPGLGKARLYDINMEKLLSACVEYDVDTSELINLKLNYTKEQHYCEVPEYEEQATPFDPDNYKHITDKFSVENVNKIRFDASGMSAEEVTNIAMYIRYQASQNKPYQACLRLMEEIN